MCIRGHTNVLVCPLISRPKFEFNHYLRYNLIGDYIKLSHIIKYKVYEVMI